MEKRTFGKTGLQVTPLGFGGAEIGFEGATPQTVERLLNSALDAGLNVIDTAECYPGSEELIGNAVSQRRGEFYLFTKCGHPEGMGKPSDWSKAGLLRSIDRSLERLRTDRLDLVQLHSCSEEELRKGEVIEALQQARAAGKSRFIGYSGDSSAALYAVECGAFDTLQTSVSIADQEAIELTLPLARKRNLGVIAKRPIANAAWRTGRKPDSPYHHTYWDRLQVLKYDFLKGDVNEAVATALRFTLSVPGVHTAIVGTINPARWKQNADLVARGPLPEVESRAIRERWKAVAKSDWVGQV
jgi:aryl-alcohol dehydrogenase-like predicted oxidoreductase